MGELRHDIPIAVEAIAGAEIFVEQHTTAEVGVIVVITKLASVDNAAEAGFSEDLVAEVDRSSETGEELRGFTRSADRGAHMDARMHELLLPAGCLLKTEGIEKSRYFGENAIFMRMATLDRSGCTEAQFVENLVSGLCR